MALIGSGPRPAQADEGGTRKVLILEPRGQERAARVPSSVADLFERTTATYLERLGSYEVARPGRSQGASCQATDYDCFARASGIRSGYVVDTQVQVNPEGTLYFTVTVVDLQNPDRAESRAEGFGTPGRERRLSRADEEALAGRLEAILAELLKRVAATSAPTASLPSVALEPPPSLPAAPAVAVPEKGPRSLTIEVSGRGSVSSDRPGVECASERSPCPLKVDGAAPITLLAAPRAPASVASWEGSCINSTLAEPLRCQVALTLAQDTRIRVRLERSVARKALTGALWGLALVGIGAGAGLLGAHGQPCQTEDGRDCYIATGGYGLSSLGAGVALGVAGALTYWLPWPHREGYNP